MNMGTLTMAMGALFIGAMSTASSAANLTLGDPRCNSDSCLAFKVAHAQSQAAVSYYYQYEYGKWLSYYYVIIIFLFVVACIHLLWSYRKTSTDAPGVAFADKVVCIP